MYVCMCVYVCMYVCICLCMYVYICMYVYVYVCMYVSIMYVSMYVLCMYYVYMYVCIIYPFHVSHLVTVLILYAKSFFSKYSRDHRNPKTHLPVFLWGGGGAKYWMRNVHGVHQTAQLTHTATNISQIISSTDHYNDIKLRQYQWHLHTVWTLPKHTAVHFSSKGYRTRIHIAARHLKNTGFHRTHKTSNTNSSPRSELQIVATQ